MTAVEHASCRQGIPSRSVRSARRGCLRSRVFVFALERSVDSNMEKHWDALTARGALDTAPLTIHPFKTLIAIFRCCLILFCGLVAHESLGLTSLGGVSS